MNVLFLFASLPHLDDEVSLYTSLIHEFKKHGHNVLVSSRGNDDIEKSGVSIENGIKVLRIKSHRFTGVSNSIKKALAYQEYTVKQTFYIHKFWKDEQIDLVISHSLPPELAFTISYVKRHFHCKSYLIQSDYTWQDAVAYGMFSRSGPIACYYRFWEKLLFERSDYICCPTKGNIDFVKKQYDFIVFEKSKVIPWWQGVISVERNAGVKAELGLQGKFVVVYGGNVGKAQRLEHMINLAESVRDVADIRFLILGRGTHLEAIKDEVRQKNLENVIFGPFLPKDKYLSLLTECEVGMIILNEYHATPNFPSKTISYLSIGLPILAAVDSVTDFGDFLTENGVGLWSLAGDVPSLKENLMKYFDSQSLRDDVSHRETRLYMNRLLPQNAYNAIMKQIDDL